MIFEHNKVSFLVTVSIAIAFGTFYRPYDPSKDILKGLVSIVGDEILPSSSSSSPVRIAIGTNVCVDLIVPAKDVLSITANDKPQDNTVVSSMNDINSVFLHHFMAGAAGERSCTSDTTFRTLVQTAEKVTDARHSLGGNAAIMARKLSKLGAEVYLSGNVGPVAASLLPSSVHTLSSSSSSSSVPADDEVHVILEYPRGLTMGEYTASRANRFILTADLANADMSDTLRTLISTADAKEGSGTPIHVLIVSGLHMLEPLPIELRNKRLQTIKELLEQRQGKYAVHIELASSADKEWTVSVANALFPCADSIGFNEVEAAFLYEALGGTYTGGSSSSTNITSNVTSGIVDRNEIVSLSPRIRAISSLLRYIFEQYSSLSRIHYHSLVLHLIAHTETNGSNKKWNNPQRAVAAGSLTATLEACGVSSPASLINGNDDLLYTVSALRINVADPRPKKNDSKDPAEIVQNLSPSIVGSWSWETVRDDTIHFAIAPVAACRHPKSTVGLGDTISSAGILADIPL